MTITDEDLPPIDTEGGCHTERHILQAETELRLEVSTHSTSCSILLQKGSCELWGIELAIGKAYTIQNRGFQVALLTFYGCVVDITCDHLEIVYVSDEIHSNLAAVNTHAQLEALRDDAPPRVLICGPPESGKSSLCKLLVAYALKVGRSLLWADLDPQDNAIGVPGTLTVAPMTQVPSLESFAQTTLLPGESTPLLLWHGSKQIQADLFRAQVTALATKMKQRVSNEPNNGGWIVNTSGWIQQDHSNLKHTIQALDITVVLILGHDRLYSMLNKDFKDVKIVKLPRSGGVVSRDASTLRHFQSKAVHRYFYGDNNSLTPNLLQVSSRQLTLYKFTAMALSASLLPVAATQSTEAIQLVQVEWTEQLQHSLVAVCHPNAVARYQESGQAQDLYAAGIAGICVVERVLTDTDMVHLLSPCAGALPSNILLVGDVTWMD